MNIATVEGSALRSVTPSPPSPRPSSPPHTFFALRSSLPHRDGFCPKTFFAALRSSEEGAGLALRSVPPPSPRLSSTPPHTDAPRDAARRGARAARRGGAVCAAGAAASRAAAAASKAASPRLVRLRLRVEGARRRTRIVARVRVGVGVRLRVRLRSRVRVRVGGCVPAPRRVQQYYQA